MSVHGKRGSGSVYEAFNYRVSDRIIIAVTLGKAFGALGGLLVLPTEEDKLFLKVLFLRPLFLSKT